MKCQSTPPNQDMISSASLNQDLILPFLSPPGCDSSLTPNQDVILPSLLQTKTCFSPHSCQPGCDSSLILFHQEVIVLSLIPTRM